MGLDKPGFPPDLYLANTQFNRGLNARKVFLPRLRNSTVYPTRERDAHKSRPWPTLAKQQFIFDHEIKRWRLKLEPRVRLPGRAELFNILLYVQLKFRRLEQSRGHIKITTSKDYRYLQVRDKWDIDRDTYRLFA